MPNKSNDDVFQLRRERVRVRWECYRRNEAYKTEHKKLFGRIKTKEECDILGLKHLSEADTPEQAERKTQMVRELFESLQEVVVSEHDIDEINALGPLQHFSHGNLFIVLFCERWHLRYPKAPAEDFIPEKDRSLFTDVFPLGALPSIPELQAPAVLEALKSIEIRAESYGISLAQALQMEREETLQLRDYHKKKREQSSQVILAVDTQISKQEIFAEFEDYINYFQQRVKKKNYRRRHEDWEQMFRAWGLRQEGHKHPDIASMIAKEFEMLNEPEDWKISDWCKYAEEMIAEVEQAAVSYEILCSPH